MNTNKHTALTNNIINVPSNSRTYMNVNVILTFDTFDKYRDSQEFFELKLPINKHEIDAITFLNNKLFNRIAQKCIQYNRRADELIKISTASDWGLFEKHTNKPSIYSQGHSCKWFFGNGRTDLDDWEKSLMSQYGFGTNADMSYLNAENVSEAFEIKFQKILKLNNII